MASSKGPVPPVELSQIPEASSAHETLASPEMAAIQQMAKYRDMAKVHEDALLGINTAVAAYWPAGTKGALCVYNDSQTDVTISTYEYYMGDWPPTGTEVKAGSKYEYEVSASWRPYQSAFTMTFNDQHVVKTELGSVPFHTSISPVSFSDGKVGVLAAPKAGPHFDLHYCVGPGLVQSFLNGFIQANLPALINHINKVGIPLFFSLSADIKLSNINLNPADLQISYASMTPAGGTAYVAKIVINLNKISATGQVKSAFGTHDYNFSLSNLAVIGILTVDLPKKSVDVTKIECSLGDVSIDWVLWEVLVLLCPPLAAVTAIGLSGINLATILNTAANSLIVDAISKALKGAIAKLPGSTPHFVAAAAGGDAQPAVSQVTDFSQWMTNSNTQEKLMSQIHIPGTHDSGAYALTNTLSTVAYPDIAFLWTLSPDSAPVNGKIPVTIPPTRENPLYIGKTLYDYVISPAVHNISTAGDKSFLEQLEGGIRHFDLRVYHESDDHFYLQHALKGPRVDDVLDQIQSFIAKHTGAAELIFLNFSHATYTNDVAKGLSKLVHDKIASENIFYEPDSAGKSRFDFELLATRKLKDITGGKTKVMVINSDSGLSYPSPITNSQGYDGDGTKPLGALIWAHTPDALIDIVPYVLELLSGSQDWLLKRLAIAKNGDLAAALQKPENRCNLTAVDWFELSSGLPVVPLIVGMNGTT